MKALIFPGQGSQSVGMGQELYKNFDLVKKVFKDADEKLNYPISKIILDGPEAELKLTENTQPAILTVSYSIFKIITEVFNIDLKKGFTFFAGHSLGEYSALVSVGSLTFEDALYLLYERGKSMQEAVPEGHGAMLAVLGIKLEDIEKFIREIKVKGICEIANDNANGQVIISGNKKSVESFQMTLKKHKIKSIPLKVSAPFHCLLMKPAAKSMEEKINNTEFKDPLFKIISNVTANSESKPNTIKRLLIEQIFSTVKWREGLIYMSNGGIKNFVEIGPGKVLTGMVKRTVKEPNCFSINSITDIKNFVNEFKK